MFNIDHEGKPKSRKPQEVCVIKERNPIQNL